MGSDGSDVGTRILHPDPLYVLTPKTISMSGSGEEERTYDDLRFNVFLKPVISKKKKIGVVYKTWSKKSKLLSHTNAFNLGIHHDQV